MKSTNIIAYNIYMKDKKATSLFKMVIRTKNYIDNTVYYLKRYILQLS